MGGYLVWFLCYQYRPSTTMQCYSLTKGLGIYKKILDHAAGLALIGNPQVKALYIQLSSVLLSVSLGRFYLFLVGEDASVSVWSSPVQLARQQGNSWGCWQLQLDIESTTSHPSSAKALNKTKEIRGQRSDFENLCCCRRRSPVVFLIRLRRRFPINVYFLAFSYEPSLPEIR